MADDPGAGLPDDTPGRFGVPACVDEMTGPQAEDGAVGERLVTARWAPSPEGISGPAHSDN